LIVARVFAQEEVLQYLQFVLRPVGVFLRSMGFSDRDYDGAAFRFVPMPLLLGASLSGPALLLALAVGWVSNRYRVMITHRTGNPPEAIEAAVDSAETQSRIDSH